MDYHVYCNKVGHNKSQVVALCIEPDCKEQRCCCAMCIIDDHSDHIKSVQKLDDLKAKNPRKNEARRLLDELRSKTNKLLHLFDSIISDSSLTYPETMNLTNLNQFGFLISSQSKMINTKQLQESIQSYTLLIDQTYNRIENKFREDQAKQLKNLGYKQYSIGNYEEALDFYNQSLKIIDQEDDCLNKKGAALDELKRYEEAIQCYDKAIQINPNDSGYYSNKGTALYELKRYEEAIQCHDKAIQINPNVSNYYSNKGVALYGLKRQEEAIQSYDKAIQINPNCSNYYSNKSLALDELKRYEEAIQYALAIYFYFFSKQKVSLKTAYAAGLAYYALYILLT